MNFLWTGSEYINADTITKVKVNHYGGEHRIEIYCGNALSPSAFYNPHQERFAAAEADMKADELIQLLEEGRYHGRNISDNAIHTGGV